MPKAEDFINLNSLQEMGRRVRRDKDNYEAQLRMYIHSLEPNRERFWDILPYLQKEIENDKDIKDGIEHFMWKTYTVKYDFKLADIPTFIRSYDEIEVDLVPYLDQIYDGGSDDGFSDLCDSMPLAGLGVYDAVLAGKYKGAPAKLYTAIKKENPKIHPYIVGKGLDPHENYVSMTLHDKFAEYLAAS